MVSKNWATASKPKSVVVYQPVWLEEGIRLTPRTMQMFQVESDSTGYASEWCAKKFYSAPSFFQTKLPWYVGIIQGQNPICCNATDVDDKLNQIRIPADCANRYIPIAKSKNSYLIYYNNLSHYMDSKYNFYVHKTDDFPEIENNELGRFINENKLINDIRKSDGEYLKHSWINDRIKLWQGGYCLPANWLTFNLPMAFILTHLHESFSETSAWENMWLGKNFTRKDKK